MRKKFLQVGVCLTVGLLAVFALLQITPRIGGGEIVDAGGTIASEKTEPVAIGAMRLSGVHLVPPSDNALMAILLDDGAIAVDSTDSEIQAAREEYLKKFYKHSDTWVSSEFQEWVSQREKELANPNRAPEAVKAVTATVFAMAVDFGATETFNIPVDVGGSCVTQSVTITGPMAGEMDPPLAGDNFTLWYSPELTTDASFYKKIIFGYEGAGRARYDMTDPVDGQPGVNLAGYTVQDYYDHIAGMGNVHITGTVEGWVTVPHSEGYYGADNCWTGSSGGGAGTPVAQLVVDAVEVFSDTHPAYYTETGEDAFWPKYDANKDGILDTFWIIHAGAGQEGGGGEEGAFSIWAHSSDLRNYAAWEGVGYKVYEGDAGTTADDIYVGPYTMQPENSETGVFAEEFGHNFFGLPDLYTNDANNSIGDWNIMSGGAWMGYLGGTVPAGMPLWFKMIAAFDTAGNIEPVNWHVPMVDREYDDPEGDETIGQLEQTAEGVDKGVRVNLPTYTLSIDNMAGEGKAAYSGTGRDQVNLELEMPLDLGSCSACILTLDAYWEIEEDWDYGYVMVDDTPLADLDGVTTNFNPNGNNLGNGITGDGDQTLQFDLSAYKGRSISPVLKLRYKTDAGTTEAGWWVDNVKLDGVLLDDFEGATLPGTFDKWTNTDPGWYVVPTTGTFERYYLVEWRTMTKYDQMIHKGAYVHNTDTPDYVTRIPYNMPAALVYYRDTQYGSTYAMSGNSADPPSYGSKYQLLIVDQNWEPVRLGDTPATYEGYWSGRINSYDAGLTLQATEAFSIPAYYGLPGSGPWEYASKPAVTKFSDALGYYGGYFFGSPCPTDYICPFDRYGSAVIPARDRYSVRIADFYGDPIYGFYGISVPPSWLGSGKPGDDNVQFGVNIELLSKVGGEDDADSTATLHFSNYSVDIDTTLDEPVIVGDVGDTYTLTYQTLVENTGVETTDNVTVTYDLYSGLAVKSLTCTSGVADPNNTRWSGSGLASGEIVTITLVVTGTYDVTGWNTTWVEAFDGQIDRGPWYVDSYITALSYVYMPLIVNNAQ